jgi:DNA invertase Pin-like site-specific DNA recombinase
MGCEVVKVYKDHGISGAKGRDKRPACDALCRDAAQRKFDVVIAWSVDRLGRSLQDLGGFLSELRAGVMSAAGGEAAGNAVMR